MNWKSLGPHVLGADAMASGVEVLTARPVQGVVMTTVVRLGGWGVVSVHGGQLTLSALGV